MATITVLLFDFGGTLDGPAHWLDRFLASYRAAGIEISRAELDPAFDHATRIGYGATRVVARFGLTDLVRFLVGHQFEYLRKSGPEPLRKVLDDAGAAGRYRFVEAVTNSFVRETSIGLAHSREVVGQLRSRFKMGIVSNFYGNLDRILEEAKLDRYFAAVADSSRVGIFKPEPGIFETALKKIQCAPESAAMIGDSLAKDCAPARKLGMRTVWLRTAAQSGDDASAADITIRSIDEVAQIQW
ncbi:MAG: HAD family hydrolase [Candidatus Binatus sp.]|jgi:HAD superfamily hydrolase (TIGR01509 family)|uniref:HAD family hydrolase n=1 Tax=Candidatus Binatus sp. TaxID=2811406 RepID=UPI003C789322